MKKITIIVFLFISFMVFLGISQLTPPDVVYINAPYSQFSSGRAIKHLEVIARRPHPIGSPEHLKVRNYIFDELSALELNPQIQTSSVITSKWEPDLKAGIVHNIIVKLPGTQSTKGSVIDY